MPRGRTATLELAYDEVAVRILVAGESFAGRPRAADVWEAIRRLNAAGFSDGQIAYRIGYSRRHVARVRTEQMQLPPAVPSGSGRAGWRVQAPSLHWRRS